MKIKINILITLSAQFRFQVITALNFGLRLHLIELISQQIWEKKHWTSISVRSMQEYVTLTFA